MQMCPRKETHPSFTAWMRRLGGAAIVAATAASAGTSGATPAHAEHPEHRRFAWLANDAGNTYDAATLAGIRDTVPAPHGRVDPFYAGFDPATQLAQCQEALRSKKYDGLFIEAASGTEIAPCVAHAHELGVPVVAVDLPMGPDESSVVPQYPGEVGACFIAAPDYGNSLIGFVPQACEGLDPCNVLYVAGLEALSFDQDAILAIQQVAATVPSVHLVDHGEAYYDTATAHALVLASLAAHPEINLVVAGGDQMALGAEQAATEIGASVRILGGGAGASAIQAVKEGRWLGTFNALPRTEGHIAAQMMLRAIDDEDAEPRGADPLTVSQWPLWWTQASLAANPTFVPEWPGP